jgi:phage/plasmid-like protein (TIGR03299 family)
MREDGSAEMFSGRNLTPWHKLGKVVDGTLTAQEAIMAAQLNWKVDLRPVFVDGKVVGEFRGVVRNDNSKVLSIVGTRYEPIQNEDSFNFFDEVVGTGQAVYDTAGSLFEGRKVFISAKLPNTLFLKNNPADTMEKFVLLYTSHDGTSGLCMQIVTVRVVCKNTLSMALGTKSNCIKIRHTKSYKDKVNEAQKTLQLVHGYYDNLQAVIDSLSEQKMTDTEAIAMTERLFPSKEKEVATRTENTRNEVLELFRRGVGNKGETKWDFLNGVTEYVTHSRGTRVSEGGNEEESRMASILFGSGSTLSQRALNLLQA